LAEEGSSEDVDGCSESRGKHAPSLDRTAGVFGKNAPRAIFMTMV